MHWKKVDYKGDVDETAGGTTDILQFAQQYAGLCVGDGWSLRSDSLLCPCNLFQFV